jgi:uncharacterized surface protein with fasciclin (FAS1) repeats
MLTMTPMQRRGFLALGGVAAGTLAAPRLVGAQQQRPTATIANTLAGDTRFSRFLDLVTRVSAVENLNQVGPITLFAPTDQAFAGAPAGILQDLLGMSGSGQNTGDAERQRVLALINYHIVPGALRAEEIAGADRRLRTLNGADIQVSGSAGSLRLQNPAPGQQIAGFGAAGMQANPRPTEVSGPPIQASNGVIYPINQILWP